MFTKITKQESRNQNVKETRGRGAKTMISRITSGAGMCDSLADWKTWVESEN